MMKRYRIIASILYCGLQSISMHAMFMQDMYIEREYALFQNRTNALHTAARENNIERARIALGTCEINARDKRSETALHIATCNGYIDMVNLLIDNGADPDISAVGKNTPLHKALRNGQEEAALLLIEKAHANIHIKNNNGETALHAATKQNFAHIVHRLIDKGALVDVESTFSGTPLHIAAEHNFSRIIDLLIQAGADINFLNMFVGTPLYVAVSYGYTDLVITFMRHGADVNAVDVAGTSALHTAAEKGYVDIVAFLIENGANCHAKNAPGNTALHEAAYARNTTSAQHLIQAGSTDLTTENRNSKTAYHIAQDNNDQDMILLIEKTEEANQQIKQRLANGDRPESIIMDLAQPTAVFSQASDEQQAELLAHYPRILYAYLDRQHTLQTFITHNNIAKSWLLDAIQYGHDAICTLLCKNGKIQKNVNDIQDQFGNRALHLAALYNRPHACKNLLYVDAIIDCKNKKYQTPWDVAKEHSSKKVGKIIARYGHIKQTLKQDKTGNVSKLPFEMIRKVTRHATALSHL